MWDHFVERHLRRAGRNYVLVGLVLLAIAAASVAASQRYLYNYRFGPFPITATELIKAPDPLKLPKVWVTYDSPLPGMAIGDETQDGKRTVAYYHMVVLDFTVNRVVKPATEGHKAETVPASPDERKQVFSLALAGKDIPKQYQVHASKGLLVRTKEPTLPAGKVTGYLTQISHDARKEFRFDKIGDNMLDAMLDTRPYRKDGQIGYPIAGLLALIGLLIALNGLRYFLSPTSHPDYRRLAAYGHTPDVVQAIEMELSTDGTRQQIGPFEVTSNWALRRKRYGLDIVPLDHLIWVYKKVVQQYYNGVPSGKQIAALLCDRDGRQLEFSGKEKPVDALLADVLRRRPWLVTGYSDQLDAAYKQDRQGFIAAVEDRRREIRSGGEQPV